MTIEELLACDGFQAIAHPEGEGLSVHPALMELHVASGLPLAIRQARTGIELFLVMPGRFLMGASGQELFDAKTAEFARARQYIEEENERMLRLDKPYWMTSLPDRGPVPDDQRSTVVIEAPFYMACTEVSRKQWGTITPLDHSPHTSWLSPAVNVAFEDAIEFCKQAGGHLSLPTDAQWEYVARAGMKTPYSRKNIDTSLVNYDGEGDTMQGAVRGERRGGPVDVGTLPGNSWGFREMLGNVAEWVLSSQASPPREGWNQARGGSFAQPAIDVRCASVEWYPPKHRSETIGFRVVKAIPSFARAT